jgi:hypothetical protein
VVVVVVAVVVAVVVVGMALFVWPIVSRCQSEPGTFGVETSGWMPWPALQLLRRRHIRRHVPWGSGGCRACSTRGDLQRRAAGGCHLRRGVLAARRLLTIPSAPVQAKRVMRGQPAVSRLSAAIMATMGSALLDSARLCCSFGQHEQPLHTSVSGLPI